MSIDKNFLRPDLWTAYITCAIISDIFGGVAILCVTRKCTRLPQPPVILSVAWDNFRAILRLCLVFGTAGFGLQTQIPVRSDWSSDKFRTDCYRYICYCPSVAVRPLQSLFFTD